MRVAVIDLGTNTFNLLVVEVTSSTSYEMLFRTKVAVNLGKGMSAKNMISEEAMLRGISALKGYKGIIQRFKAERTFAFATSAIRSSKNGHKFIKAAKDQTGIEIKIITGDKEATYIYHGVKKALNIGDSPSLILDIGGGSNEFIIGTQQEILWKGSYDIGVARLLDKFTPSDPIKPDEIAKIENYLEENLSSLFDAVKQNPVKELIGSSGSFDTFAAMICTKFSSVEELKNKTELDLKVEHYNQIHNDLIHSTKAERMENKAIVGMRVDMIVLASILVNFIITKLDLKRMRLSTFALKEGVLSEILR